MARAHSCRKATNLLTGVWVWTVRFWLQAMKSGQLNLFSFFTWKVGATRKANYLPPQFLEISYTGYSSLLLTENDNSNIIYYYTSTCHKCSQWEMTENLTNKAKTCKASAYLFHRIRIPVSGLARL